MAMTGSDNDNNDEKNNGNDCSKKDNGDKNVEEEEEDNNIINDNDFVIRNGFPALFESTKEETKKKYLLEGNEPIPQYLFQSFDNFFQFPTLEKLRNDCTKVFTARTKDSGSSYSSGQTYWMPCEMPPRCALEKMALEIFLYHTKSLAPGTFDSSTSGAEWWTLVLDTAKTTNTSTSKKEHELSASATKRNNDDDDSDDDDEDDDVGMHFDADYGLEAQAEGCMIHPRLATITYLSDVGVPTLILDASLHDHREEKKGDDDDDHDHDYESHPLEGCVKRGWLSSPRIGKHVAFDGRLLHGAPGYVFPSCNDNKEEAISNSTSSSAAAKGRTSVMNDTKRYTFLVNIWLNHCPLDAELLEDDIVETLTTPYQIKEDDNTVPPPLKKQKTDPDNKTNDVIFTSTKAEPSKIEHFTLAPCCSSSSSPSNEDDEKKKESNKNEGGPSNKDDDGDDDEPVGVEETVICQREVTLLFNMTSKECREISNQLASRENSSSAELTFLENALQICVGEEVTLDDDEDDDNDDEEDK